MYARLVQGQVPPEKLNDAIELWLTSVAPSAQQRQGFKNVRLLVERATGKIVSMALWESEADFEATVAWNQEQIARFAGLFSIPPSVHGLELVAELSAK
jgi:hypothetical protein